VPTSDNPIYLDSSALVKRAIVEPESAALEAFLIERPQRASCALARTEVIRAVSSHGSDAVRRARDVITGLSEIIQLKDELLDRAANLEPPALRSLDAIHLAAALELADEPGELVTYDQRMQDAARALGFTVVAPA